MLQADYLLLIDILQIFQICDIINCVNLLGYLSLFLRKEVLDMENRINITAERMNGNFMLVRVIDTSSSNIVLFGTYRGGYEGRLVVPPQSILTTAAVSEIHEQLNKQFPDTIWTINYGEEPKSYEALKKAFESAGIHEEVPEVPSEEDAGDGGADPFSLEGAPGDGSN